MRTLFSIKWVAHIWGTSEHHLHVRLTFFSNFLTPFYSLPLSYVEHVTHSTTPFYHPAPIEAITLLKMIIFRTSLWTETIFIRSEHRSSFNHPFYISLHDIAHNVECGWRNLWKIFDLCQWWPQWYRNWRMKASRKFSTTLFRL